MTQHSDWFAPGTRCAVLTAEPIGRPLDYLAPDEGCFLGAFVEVPLGPRKALGVVWGAGDGQFDSAKLRRITRVLEAEPMREELRHFLLRMADYTMTPLPQILRLATRAPGLADPPGMRKVYRLGATLPTRMTDPRERVIAVLRDHGGAGFQLGELAALAGVTTQVVKGLAKAGAVIESDVPRDAPFVRLDPSRPGKHLSPAQDAAATTLRDKAGAFGTVLLKGVTGSGKTEVYLEAVAECLRQGRQALVMLPEIALSAEFLSRVQARFGALPGEWHSGVTQTERRRLWKACGTGEAQMVVGARSSLFLPFRDLGLIVVDEEHDTSYKQEEGVLYNARDMAVLRGSLCGAQVVLASATPSLETWANADSGKYDRVDLAARFGAAELPAMGAIDMRDEQIQSNQWIGSTLMREITARIARGEQSMLFLNRRGYAPVTICRACGHQIGCDHCDARMVEHRFQNRLVCHQCGEEKPILQTCPSCKVEGKLAPVGPGVERLAEEVAQRFPDARLAVLSSDLFASARALKAAIATIADGEADIIIGTQIVAKGHNFPKLTLVGVVDADLGLQGSDLRAAERTFQLLRQVAGRAGRAETKGIALLQSYQPEHPVLRAILAGDEEEFWRAEAAQRKSQAVPPYGRMAGIILSGPDLKPLFDIGETLARQSRPLQQIGAMIFGPAPAPIARVRGRHRVRMLIKAEKAAPLQKALAVWVAQVKLPSNVRLAIDIDPQSFF
ncbi:primosomal protein N' [Thioclava sp. SK-1]|uniref:primosomal protein N' n=1 Tax=Thioclava sp. SK-1 TaxID=1889770 RepID=UPI0008262CEF|nr:primosomal protein N' [Thioclava sp. SK-1]OCX65829.1 primosomal protein N' [Thioclava sp. SK-1]